MPSVDLFYISSDFREQHEEIADLAKSIAEMGLINPITVIQDPDGKFDVVAGRRRFKALTEFLFLKELNEGEHYRVRPDADRLVIQLEENLRRKDFTPIEVARLIRELHTQRILQHGSATRGCPDSGWSLDKTAQIICRDKGFVSRMLTIASNEELVKDCSTVKEALERVAKEKMKDVHQKVAQARLERIEKSVDLGEIEEYFTNYKNLPALDWLADQEAECADLIFTDPPYGINLDKNVSADAYMVYEDDPEKVLSLLSACIPEYYRILKPNKYCVIWTSFTLFTSLLREMTKAGFTVDTTPIVWPKLNTTGKANNPAQTLGSACEIAAYGWKGNAELAKKGSANIFPAPIVRSNRIHVAQKPEALIATMLDVFSMPGDLVIDTFTGSGSTIRGCILQRRRFAGCELDQHNFATSKTFTLDWFNNLNTVGNGEGSGNV